MKDAFIESSILFVVFFVTSGHWKAAFGNSEFSRQALFGHKLFGHKLFGHKWINGLVKKVGGLCQWKTWWP
jgi:hypothetical protein